MKVSPYLNFDGNCEEAMRFYAACTGGEVIAMMKFAGTPAEAHVPPEMKDKVLHACISMNGTELMASDAACGNKTPQGFSVALHVNDPAEAERVFHALGEGGKVEMPIQQTFWAERFGSLVDRYGISWMVNCDGGRSR
jgi:PhnB protein